MKFVLAFLLMISCAQAQEVLRPCDRNAFFSHTAATGPVAVVPGVAGQRIYFCGFTIVQRGPTLDLVISMGDGATCATNKTNLTHQIELPADFAVSSVQAATVPIAGSEGKSLCIQTIGSSGKLGGIISYTQF